MTDQTAVAVMPRRSPFASDVSTVTAPLARSAMVLRRRASVFSSTSCSGTVGSAMPAGAMLNRDVFGYKRIGGLARKIEPDVIVIQNDPWNIPEYMDALEGFPRFAQRHVERQ